MNVEKCVLMHLYYITNQIQWYDVMYDYNKST